MTIITKITITVKIITIKHGKNNNDKTTKTITT